MFNGIYCDDKSHFLVYNDEVYIWNWITEDWQTTTEDELWHAEELLLGNFDPDIDSLEDLLGGF